MTLPKHVEIWMKNKKPRVVQVKIPKHIERHQKLVSKILEAVEDFKYYDDVIFDRIPKLTRSDIVSALKIAIGRFQ